jgi:hypothetical protein
MSLNPSQLSPMQKNIARAVGCLMPIVVLAIMMGVLNGTLSERWLILVGVLFYGSALIVLVGVVGWIVQRFRGSAPR